MLEQLLAGTKDGVIKDLMTKLGLNADQAGSFLQKGLALLEGAIKSGGISGSSLTQGSAGSVLSKLNLGSLTSLVGGDAGKARSGMESILTPLLNGIKSNSGVAQNLLGQLAGASHEGIGARVASFAGKVFGKH